MLTTRLSCHILRDLRELESLRSEWTDLVQSCVRPEPVLFPEWLLTWWQRYGDDRTLAVGAYRANGSLVGLAPMSARTFRYRPGIPFQRIESLGADVDEGDSVCSDYLHLIVRPGFEAAVCDAFVADMTSGAFGLWDEWHLGSVDGSHPVTPILGQAWKKAGFRMDVSHRDQCPYLTLPTTYEGYLATLSKSGRRSLRSAEVDFEKWADGAASFHRATDAASLAAGRDALHSLHQTRWHAEGGRGVFASPRFAAFHRDYMEQLLAEDRLELRWIEHRGRPIAAFYGYRLGNKLYYYQAGRVVDVPNKVRLGIVTLIHVIRESIQAGLSEFDFLAGESEYKSLFTKTSRPIVDLRVARPSVREGVRRAVSWSARVVRRVQSRLLPAPKIGPESLERPQGAVNENERSM